MKINSAGNFTIDVIKSEGNTAQRAKTEYIDHQLNEARLARGFSGAGAQEKQEYYLQRFKRNNSETVKTTLSESVKTFVKKSNQLEDQYSAGTISQSKKDELLDDANRQLEKNLEKEYMQNYGPNKKAAWSGQHTGQNINFMG